MDFVSKAFSQLGEVFAPMTMPARITTGLLVVAILVSLTYLFRTQSDSPDEFLFGANYLTQREIDNMALAFGNAQLNGWTAEQHRIKVPRGQRHLYLAAINDANAYPEHPGIATAEMLEDISPLESRDVREQKARRADERDLESQIREMSGIEETRVTITERPSSTAMGFGRRMERHVLVSVRPFGNTYLDEAVVNSIRLAGARGAGVEPDYVTVVDNNSGRTYDAHSDGGPNDSESKYAMHQRRAEEAYRNKIRDALSFIPGVGVSVYVELDKVLRDETQTQTYDKAQPVHTSSVQKDSSSTTPSPAGIPGMQSNVGNTARAVGETAAENTTTEVHEEATNVAGTTRKVTTRAPLTTEYVTASIRIPWSYYTKVWYEQNPPAEDGTQVEPTQDDLKQVEAAQLQGVKEMITHIIPKPPPGDTNHPEINVHTIYETPLPMPAGPGVAEKAGSWFAGNWQTLGMFVMALIGLFMLRGMVTATKASSMDGTSEALRAEALQVFAGDQEESKEGVDDDEEEDFGNSLRAKFQHSGRSLRDELTELVREDPDAAANVLQNWIGDAA